MIELNRAGGRYDLAADLARDLDGSFERLVLTFQDQLFGFAWRMTGNPHDAEELTQDALIRAYRALQGYHPARRQQLELRPWLYQITLNVIRNRLRRKRLPVRSLDHSGLAPLELEDHTTDRPERVVEQREHRDELATCLAGLPERYRTAVVLRHINGLSYAEIAPILGLPVGTVKTNVHRGVRQLRSMMSAELQKVG